MVLKKHIKTTIRDYLNEHKEVKSNLNDNFLVWFGDSKVVDEQGNPMIVYHATKIDFKTFNFSNSLQKIIWFTNDLDAIRNKEVGASGYDFTKELYVSCKNPCGWEEYKKYGLGQLKEMGYDGCILKNSDGTFNGFVFNPNQIKSIQNKGTWSINSKNIYI